MGPVDPGPTVGPVDPGLHQWTSGPLVAHSGFCGFQVLTPGHQDHRSYRSRVPAPGHKDHGSQSAWVLQTQGPHPWASGPWVATCMGLVDPGSSPLSIRTHGSQNAWVLWIQGPRPWESGPHVPQVQVPVPRQVLQAVVSPWVGARHPVLLVGGVAAPRVPAVHLVILVTEDLRSVLLLGRVARVVRDLEPLPSDLHLHRSVSA